MPAAIITGEANSNLAAEKAPEFIEALVGGKSLRVSSFSAPVPKTASTMKHKPSAFISIIYSFNQEVGIVTALLWYMVIACCIYVVQSMGAKKEKTEEDAETIAPQATTATTV